MGTIQILTKCCNSDDFENIDNDDDEPKSKPIEQKPVLFDKNDKLISDVEDSFTTTIPCNFPN